MARCKHRDQLNLCTTKAWLQGCAVTQPEIERKIVTDIVNMTNMDLRVVLLLYSLCLAMARTANLAVDKSDNQLAVWVILKIFRKFSLKAHYYPAHFIGAD